MTLVLSPDKLLGGFFLETEKIEAIPKPNKAQTWMQQFGVRSLVPCRDERCFLGCADGNQCTIVASLKDSSAVSILLCSVMDHYVD